MSGSLGTAAVMGAGAWGTALAKVLADAGSDVRLWARRPEVEHEVNTAHNNNRYLHGVNLPSAIRATTDPAVALDGVTTVLLGVPSQTLRNSGAMSPAILAKSTGLGASGWRRAKESNCPVNAAPRSTALRMTAR